MSYFTLSCGEKIYYEDKGNAPETVVMMHGWSSSHEIYTEPAEMISKKARVIIYDHRGHGNSKDANSGSPSMETLAGDVHELITGLDLSDVILSGWSMGAGVVFNYVRLFGCERLKKIILCDMTPKQLNDDEWKLGLYRGRYTKEDMEKDAGKKFYSLYKEFAIGAVPKLAKIPGFLLRRPLKKLLAGCDESVLRSLAVSMKTQDNRDVVGKITVPVVYFFADPGSLFLPELASWYAEHVETPFSAVRFPDSTHMFIKEHPVKFAEEVLKLL